jgi:hypothetical protein
LRRAQQRRGALSRESPQSFDAKIVASLPEAFTRTLFAAGISPPADRSLILLGRPIETDPTLARVAWRVGVARLLPPPSSREVVLSYVGAQC